MSPELSAYLKEIAVVVDATERLFAQSEAAVIEADIQSATVGMQELSARLQQFAGDEKRLAAKHLTEALTIIGGGRESASRRWDDERTS